MTSSGVLYTSLVVGSYWMQLDQVVLENHLAGRDGEFLPTSKAVVSVMLMRSLPLPRSRSSSMFSSPRTRFSPLLSMVAAALPGW